MHIKLKFIPKDEIYLGIRLGIHKIVTDLNRYDPDREDYEKAYVLDIGFLLGSIEITFK